MKKGFTLIELLSVIVILAIISVIAVPTLLGVVSKAKLNALKSSAYGLIEASNLYYAQHGSNNYRFDIEGSKVISNDTDKLLTFKGNVKNGVSIIKPNGKTVVCVTDGKNSAYKNYNEEKVNLISGKVCTIPSSSSVVYLDGDSTIDELSNQDIIDKFDAMEERITALETENRRLKTNQDNTLNNVYPVGSIYMSIDNTNPSTLFGGTWQKIEGRFLLGSSSSYALGTTGGNTSVSYTPAGTVGNHTLTVNEMPSHSHNYTLNGHFTIGNTDGSGTSGIPNNEPGWGQYGNAHWFKLGISNTGGSQAHNHPFTGTQSNINVMNPYIVVNIWKRTA